MAEASGGGISVVAVVGVPLLLADARCLPEAEPVVRARIACGGCSKEEDAGWLVVATLPSGYSTRTAAPLSVTSVTLLLSVASVALFPLPPVGFAGPTIGDAPCDAPSTTLLSS